MSPGNREKKETNMKTIENGDMVKVHYTGKLDDDTIFDATDENSPSTFIVGSDTILPHINEAFIGMKVGDMKQITIAPEDAFGPWDETQVRKLSRLFMEGDEEPMIGQVVKLNMDTGDEAQYGKIIRFDELTFEVDLNHPLAGKTLHYMIKVLDILKKDEIENKP